MIYHFKAIIAYDGTDFHGWQIQDGPKTIAGSLEQAFTVVFNKSCTVVGASRTDAGVHALGQVARCTTDFYMPVERMRQLWNAVLPPAIVIRSLELVDYFHPCVDVYEKTYHYLLFLVRPLPCIARYGWHYSFIDQVDREKFVALLGHYQGTRDFASFCKQEPHQSTIRTVTSCSVKKLDRYKALLVTVKGPSFGRFQIRRMIGYALDIARRPTLAVDYIEELFRYPNHEQTLLKAEGAGLCLRKILYHQDSAV